MSDPSIAASDPTRSVWVAANAGAGKTYTLANRVARLLRARRLSRVVLVSDPFHLARAARMARRHGLDALTSPTTTDDPWGRLARQPGYFFAESVKAPLAWVMQW